MRYGRYIGYTALGGGIVGLMLLVCVNTLPALATFSGYHVPSLLQQLVHYSTPSAMMMYVILFTGAIACALPVTAAMTLLGGSLFGITSTVALALVSTSVGGAASYMALRAGVLTIQPLITNNRVTWLLSLVSGKTRLCIVVGRLIPVMPFAAVTALAACGPLSVIQFTLISSLSILPQLVLYSSMGHYAGQAHNAPEYIYSVISSFQM